jgi:VanZ family protein
MITIIERDTRYLFWLLIAYPTVAIATGDAYAQELGALSWVTIGLTVLLSSISGAASVLYKVMIATERREPIANIWLFWMANMSGSVVSGTAAMIYAKSAKFDVWYALLAVMLAAWLGAVLLNVVTKRYLSKFEANQ